MSNDIIDIKKIDINNPAEVEGAVETIIAYDLFVEAYELVRKLEGKDGKEGEEEEEGKEGRRIIEIKKSRNQEIIPKLKWIALPKFGEDEIVELFKEHFTKIFEIEDYDLWAKLKQKIVADIWYEDRDGFKEKIRKALLKNEEYLTKEKIIINGREEPSTVGNWLKDYNVALGLEPVDAAKQSEFLTNSGNMRGLKERRSPLGETAAGSEELKGGEIKKLEIEKLEKNEEVRSAVYGLRSGYSGSAGKTPPQPSPQRGGSGNASPFEKGGEIGEREKLIILFKLYEKLKISSLTPEGLEEGLFIDEDGVKGVLDDGVFTKIDPAMEKRLKELQGIIDGVAGATRGFDADSNADKTRIEEAKKLRNREIEKLEGNGIKNPALSRGRQELRSKNGDGELRSMGDDLRSEDSGSAGDKTPPPPPSSDGTGAFEKGGEKLKEKISNAYIFLMEEQEIIKQEEEDIKRIARGNVLLIGKELTHALEIKNRLRVVAALRLAVKNNLLLGWAEKGGKTDGHGLETDRHGARMIRTDKSVISENPSSIRENPSKDNKVKDAKIYLTGFLKKVLQTKLGLSEHEAAKIGAHLYNLFKKLGRDVGYLAYYDEGEGKFRWMSENKNG